MKRQVEALTRQMRMAFSRTSAEYCLKTSPVQGKRGTRIILRRVTNALQECLSSLILDPAPTPMARPIILWRETELPCSMLHAPHSKLQIKVRTIILENSSRFSVLSAWRAMTCTFVSSRIFCGYLCLPMYQSPFLFPFPSSLSLSLHSIAS